MNILKRLADVEQAVQTMGIMHTKLMESIDARIREQMLNKLSEMEKLRDEVTAKLQQLKKGLHND